MRALLVLVAVTVAAPLAATDDHGCDCGNEARLPERVVASVEDAPALWAAGGLGALGVGWAAWRRRWLPRAGLLLPLFTRLAPRDLLRHPTRGRILEAVRAAPGGPTAALARATRLNEGTLLYHLERLEKAGLVKSLRVGRDRVWYDTGTPRPDPAVLSALHAPARQSLADLVRERPGIAQRDLVRASGLARSTVHHHLASLAAAGLLERRREGVRVRWYASGAAFDETQRKPIGEGDVAGP